MLVNWKTDQFQCTAGMRWPGTIYLGTGVSFIQNRAWEIVICRQCFAVKIMPVRKVKVFWVQQTAKASVLLQPSGRHTVTFVSTQKLPERCRLCSMYFSVYVWYSDWNKPLKTIRKHAANVGNVWLEWQSAAGIQTLGKVNLVPGCDWCFVLASHLSKGCFSTKVCLVLAEGLLGLNFLLRLLAIQSCLRG